MCFENRQTARMREGSALGKENLRGTAETGLMKGTAGNQQRLVINSRHDLQATTKGTWNVPYRARAPLSLPVANLSY